MLEGRGGHLAVVLTDGAVLVAGGQPGDSQPALASAEIYDPLSETWRGAPHMTVPRANPSAVALGDGPVLVAGGFGTDLLPLTSAEVFNP